MTNGIGFSAWVEEIDGENVIASSYNYGTLGTYTVQKFPASYFDTYIYFE
jgi:surface antigen